MPRAKTLHEEEIPILFQVPVVTIRDGPNEISVSMASLIFVGCAPRKSRA